VATVAPAVPGIFSVFPNPAAGPVTVNAPYNGTLQLHSPDGRLIGTYVVAKGNNDLTLPVSLAPGMYLFTYKPADGSAEQVTRIVYLP